MEHNVLKITESMKSMEIYQRDNNLDKRDNLDEIPGQTAVYAVCGRVNGEPVNPRYIGETKDLQSCIKELFDNEAPAVDGNECFKEFMLSIKTKVLVYELLPDVSQKKRISKKKEWEKLHLPICNEELNYIH